MDASETMLGILIYIAVLTADLAHALQHTSAAHSVFDFQSWILHDADQRGSLGQQDVPSTPDRWRLLHSSLGVVKSRSGHDRTDGQNHGSPKALSSKPDTKSSISRRSASSLASSDSIRNRQKKSSGNSRQLLAVPLNMVGDDPRNIITDIFEAVENTQRVHGDCSASSGASSLTPLQFSLRPPLPFTHCTSSAIRTANKLNIRFRSWDASPTLYNDEYYYDQVGAILEGDMEGYLYGAGIAFEVGQYGGTNSYSSFCPYKYRDRRTGAQAGDLISDNISQYATTGNTSLLYQWFQMQRNKSFSDLLFSKRDICRGSDITPVTTTSGEGLWHGPYYKCGPDAVWLMTYSVPFFGCSKDNDLRFKGVVKLDFDLGQYDINQCEADPEANPFANSHKCKETTKCTFVPGQGFKLGSYKCECASGYFHDSASDPHRKNQARAFFNGTALESSYQDKLRDNNPFYDTHFQCLPCSSGCSNCSTGASCLPCAPGCTNCTLGSQCYVNYDVMIRGIPLGLQSLCMTVCLVIGAVIIRLRRSKVMKASMWILLELVIFGALLLYATVIIQYFKPSEIRCTLIPWFREVGFAIVYGALILKVYKVLAEFQSRKAHRVLVRDKDLLKYMACIVLVVVGYMAAWTAVSLDHVSEGNSMKEMGKTNEGLLFYNCKDRYWDYIIEFGELLFLLVGIYLCYCTRQAPSDYLERRYITWVIYNETLLSAIFHVTRHFIWLHFHPDYMYLLYFVRCQVTVTITLLLIIGPKIWYAHRPPEDDHFRNRAYSSSDVQDNVLPESMKLHVGVSSNGDVDLGEVNLSEMDPEDIRSELKRLYTQLQIYKTKTMRKDNPHISKRRGGRKATHRRFSLQAFHHKHRHHHHSDTGDHDHEMSRTPEESTNSAEGIAVSMCDESSVGEVRTPTVTFKPGHKAIY